MIAELIEFGNAACQVPIIIFLLNNHPETRPVVGVTKGPRDLLEAIYTFRRRDQPLVQASEQPRQRVSNRWVPLVEMDLMFHLPSKPIDISKGSSMTAFCIQLCVCVFPGILAWLFEGKPVPPSAESNPRDLRRSS